MSALSKILLDLGNEVRGADYPKKQFTEETMPQSIIVDTFDNILIKEDWFYIIGNAYKKFPLLDELKSRGFKFEYYPNFLENFFNCKKIGIAGSHGKTTTTYFASKLIDKPINVLVGDGSGIGNKDAEYFLFEACEYQNTFLNYTYDYLVVLNIDYDHPDFFKNEKEYLFSFQKAVLNAKKLIINNDCENSMKILHKNKITYGFSLQSDVVISKIYNGVKIEFDDEFYIFDFPFYGDHLIYDFVASFIVALLVNDDVESIYKNMGKLALPKRRFTECKINNFILINDYAHHPTEISAVFNAVKKKYLDKKIVCIFQPHTYSRASKFHEEFIDALNNADDVYIMPVFSSVREVEKDEDIFLNLGNNFKKYYRDFYLNYVDCECVILFLGAGDIDDEFHFLFKKLNY